MGKEGYRSMYDAYNNHAAIYPCMHTAMQAYTHAREYMHVCMCVWEYVCMSVCEYACAVTVERSLILQVTGLDTPCTRVVRIWRVRGDECKELGQGRREETGGTERRKEGEACAGRGIG